MSDKSKVFHLFLTAVICSLILPFVIANGFSSLFAPPEFEDGTEPVEPPEEFEICVSGAVRTEGKFRVDASVTYRVLMERTGACEQAVFDFSLDDFVRADAKYLVIPYREGGKLCFCVNLNSVYFREFALRVGIGEPLIEKILVFRERVGKITDKRRLREILSEEEYEGLYYKVTATDYE